MPHSIKFPRVLEHTETSPVTEMGTLHLAHLTIKMEVEEPVDLFGSNKQHIPQLETLF